jgi:hypothetical protein
MHSNLTPAQRLKNWLAAHNGQARIVLGTRMAVFASMPQLQLIVVDEEHDPSYKQQEGARYSARDLAIYRGQLENAKVILGSATPSLESWHHSRLATDTTQAGRYMRLHMPSRVGDGALPFVRRVDMNHQPKKTVFSSQLLDAIRERVTRGEQILVLLNRRGYAPRSVIPDPATAANAMQTGEQDYGEYPLHDLLPLIRRNRQVVVEQRLSSGTYGCLRFNHLHAPFNNVAIRRAVAMAVDQRDYLRAVAGEDPAGWGACEGVFTCDTAMANEEGSEVLKTRNIEAGRAALRAAGYNNERVVLVAPGDYPQINALSLVTADLLRRLGMNVEVISADWGTLVQRRTSREPVERGGWSVIHTTAGGDALDTPPVHLFLRSNGRDAWFGWPEDALIEQLRAEWLEAAEPAQARRIAGALNRRAMETLPYVPLGYYWQPSVWRRNVTNVFRTPATVFWGMGKS